MKQVDDALIDAISINWREDAKTGHLTRAEVRSDDEEVSGILTAYLQVRDDWDDLDMMAECVVDRVSCATDYRGFSYPRKCVGVLTGRKDRVSVSDGTGDSVDLNEPAFNRMMGRLFRTIVDGATAADLEVTHSDMWSTFVDRVSAIEARAAGS